MIADIFEIKEDSHGGKGLFAKRFVPAGTISIIEKGCPKCKSISPKQLEKRPDRDFMLSHAPITLSSFPNFLVPCDDRIYYINHSCNANSLDADGFDIVVRDLECGEELTCDYRMFRDNITNFLCDCGEENCSGLISCVYPFPKDLLDYWSKKIQNVLEIARRVEQPLGDYLRGFDIPD